MNFYVRFLVSVLLLMYRAPRSFHCAERIVSCLVIRQYIQKYSQLLSLKLGHVFSEWSLYAVTRIYKYDVHLLQFKYLVGKLCN